MNLCQILKINHLWTKTDFLILSLQVMKYAIEALRNGNDLDSERLRQMRENGIPEEMIDYYLEAFLWVEHSYQILCKEK